MNKITTRRAVLLANFFNVFIGTYFIIIAVVSLIKLRWYHQITIAVRVRNIVALTTTSYLAFVILIAVGLLLIGIFITSSLTFSARVHISPNERPIMMVVNEDHGSTRQKMRIGQQVVGFVGSDLNATNEFQDNSNKPNESSPSLGNPKEPSRSSTRICGRDRSLIIEDLTMPNESRTKLYCWTFWHVIASVGLIGILTIWLANWGELVRQSISNQLEYSYARYQFTNRTNHYSVLIDGMQDINNCCGQFDYSDFPHLGSTGLSYGHYPGSCCGKNVFGSNARVICKPEEIVYVRQTVSINNQRLIQIR